MLATQTRQQWGVNQSLPRLGWPVPRDKRTHAIIHHTVIVDNDVTKNIWEDIHEVRTKMKQLQTIRPDLGLDVPYNFVAFLMSSGNLIVCEGRGLDMTGAHTHGHNTAGIGIAFQGNFQLLTNMEPYVPAINQFLVELKDKLPNIGTDRPTYREVYTHRDFTTTACPGLSIANYVNDFTFIRTIKEEEMTPEDVQKMINASLSKDVDPFQDNVSHLVREAITNEDLPALRQRVTDLEVDDSGGVPKHTHTPGGVE